MTKTLYLVNGSEPYARGKFATAAQKHEVDYDYIDLKECIFFADGKDTYLYSNNAQIHPEQGYFFIRRKDEDPFYAYLLTAFLDQHGADYSDPSNLSHTLSDGKIAQLLRLTKQGVPFPKSVICRPYSYTLHRDMIEKEIGFPCVVKRTGARGEAVWLVQDEVELVEKMQEQPFEVHLVQKYMENEYDIRAIVFEDTVIGSMTRTSADGFANTAYDATLEQAPLSEDEHALALHAAKTAGVDFAGVDIVRTAEGLMVWEINKTPQLDRFIPSTGIEAMDIVVGKIKEAYL